MAKLSPGTEVEAYCGKCKKVLNHVVVAVAEAKTTRTECRTCGAVHAYRKSAPAPRGSGTAAARKTKFDTALEGRDLARAPKYDIGRAFKEDDVLNHKVFGVGLVTRLLTDKKMEVMFRDSTRLLVHSR